MRYHIFISYDGGGDNNDDGSNIGGDDGMTSVIGWTLVDLYLLLTEVLLIIL